MDFSDTTEDPWLELLFNTIDLEQSNFALLYLNYSAKISKSRYDKELSAMSLILSTKCQKPN